MASLGMKGPYKLDKDTIDKKATHTLAGNYALGRNNKKGTFLIGYVGRSDDDVNDRLKKWIGKTKRPLFKFSYASSVKEAFEKECNNYHDFKPPDNTSHPARPEGKYWKCPKCGKYG